MGYGCLWMWMSVCQCGQCLYKLHVLMAHMSRPEENIRCPTLLLPALFPWVRISLNLELGPQRLLYPPPIALEFRVNLWQWLTFYTDAKNASLGPHAFAARALSKAFPSPSVWVCSHSTICFGLESHGKVRQQLAGADSLLFGYWQLNLDTQIQQQAPSPSQLSC